MSKKKFYHDKPTWAQGLETFPMPYVNPFFEEGEDGRNDIRSILSLPSVRVNELRSSKGRTIDPETPKLEARDVMGALLREHREGFWVRWPAWPADQGDYRRAYLRKLAHYHGVTLEYRDLGNGHLLVRIKGHDQDLRPQVTSISPMEAEQLLADQQASRSAPPATAGWLRPLDRSDVRHEFEPYSAYLRRLDQVNAEDPGSGVVYPYHLLKDKRNQQIRLHQEADRYGKDIQIQALDKDHALLTLKQTDRKLPVSYDPRRRYEVQAEEVPTVTTLEKGRVKIHGGAPKKEVRLRDQKLAKATMEDLS